MKHLFLIAALFISVFYASAQFPGGAPGGAKGIQQPPSIGHVFGKLVDSAGSL
ncbi:MAG: hypothetical protein WKG06_04255 [Segetibacter sp.]